MHTFTALFDDRADAEAVQDRLEQLGIIEIDHDVDSHESAGFDRNAYSDHGSPGLWASKRGLAPPDEDRHLYEEALRRGGFLLTVNVDDAQAARVHEVLEASDAIDMSERERKLRASGFAPAAAPPVSPVAPAEAGGVIPIVEERLRIGKRQLDRGGVRVRSYVVETPVDEQVSLRDEHVDVERRAVNTPVADTADLFQERSMEMTETAEQLVVGKEARVVEEITLHKDSVEHVETVNESVRHTEVEVENIPPEAPRRP